MDICFGVVLLVVSPFFFCWILLGVIHPVRMATSRCLVLANTVIHAWISLMKTEKIWQIDGKTVVFLFVFMDAYTFVCVGFQY